MLEEIALQIIFDNPLPLLTRGSRAHMCSFPSLHLQLDDGCCVHANKANKADNILKRIACQYETHIGSEPGWHVPVPLTYPCDNNNINLKRSSYEITKISVLIAFIVIMCEIFSWNNIQQLQCLWSTCLSPTSTMEHGKEISFNVLFFSSLPVFQFYF